MSAGNIAGQLGGLLGRIGLRVGRRGAKAKTAEDEMTYGDDEPVDWVAVATAFGSIEASLIAGRLNSEGIPTRISQEAAGAAIGLTVGIGRIEVLVPEPMAERALDMLDNPVEIEIDEWQEDDFEYDE